MSTNLRWIGEKARKEPALVFTSVYHHVTDVDNLRACYEALPGNRAVGTDGVTKEDGSGRQGHNPAGGSPVMQIARFMHVAIPQFVGVTPRSLRGVKGPAAQWTLSHCGRRDQGV